MAPEDDAVVAAFSATLARLSGRGLRRSVALSAGRWAVSLAVMIVVFPLMLARLGAVGVGQWAVLTTPTSMAGVFDLGLVPAVVSLIGPQMALARDERCDMPTRLAALERVRAVATSGLGMATLISAPLVLVGLSLTTVFCRVIAGSASAPAEYLFAASIFNLAATLIGEGFTAPLEAIGRVDVSTLTAGALSVVNSLGLLVALLVSPGLSSIALVVFASGVLTVVLPATVWVTVGFLKGLSEVPAQRLDIRSVAVAGLRRGGASALGTLVDPTVKWLTSATVGPVYVAGYELAMRILGMLGGFFRAAMYPLLSHFALRHGAEDKVRLSQDVGVASRYTAEFAVPAMVAVGAAAPSVAVLWLRSTPVAFTSSLSVLSLATVVSLLAVPMYTALLAQGDAREVLVIQTWTFLVAVVACLALTALPGGARVAAAGGMSVGMTVGAVVTAIAYARRDGSRAARAAMRGMWPGCLGALSLGAVGATLWTDQVPPLVSICGVFLAYALVAWAVGRRDLAEVFEMMTAGRHTGRVA